MKKMIFILIAAMVFAGLGHAETDAASPAPQMVLVTPTPTAMPMGETFSSEDLIVTLPFGMEMLSGDALAGYKAAVQHDFPDAGRLLLTAVNGDFTAAATFSVIESDADAPDAAMEAARIILGESAAISETRHGENAYAYFSCGIGEDVYSLYYLKGSQGLLVIGLSGISEAETAAMLTGLIF